MKIRCMNGEVSIINDKSMFLHEFAPQYANNGQVFNTPKVAVFFDAKVLIKLLPAKAKREVNIVGLDFFANTICYIHACIIISAQVTNISCCVTRQHIDITSRVQHH